MQPIDMIRIPTVKADRDLVVSSNDIIGDFFDIDFRLFTETEIEYIHNYTMFDVLIRCTNITADDIQRDLFHFNKGRRKILS